MTFKNFILLLFTSVVFTFIVFNYSFAASKGIADMSQVKKLPSPDLAKSMDLNTAIAKRRSVRSFSDKPLTNDELSVLLWSAQGITDDNLGYRAAPSAGAIYPVTIYAVTAESVIVYQPESHRVRIVSDTDKRDMLSKAALGQGSVRRAACVFVITANIKKTAAKYRSKARDYVLMEAGHIAQNVHLQAVNLSLGSVPVGAFEPKKVAAVLDLPDTLEAIYMVPVGHPD